MTFLAVALGGALGAIVRYWVVAYAFPPSANQFPTGTFLVNVIGSFVIGCLAVIIIQKQLLGDPWRLFLITGFLGGFTTFSAFSLESIQLLTSGHYTVAFSYIAASLVGCIAAAGAAIVFTQKII